MLQDLKKSVDKLRDDSTSELGGVKERLSVLETTQSNQTTNIEALTKALAPKDKPKIDWAGVTKVAMLLAAAIAAFLTGLMTS